MKKALKHHYISLADILANGVVIMIILIVLSLSIKHYQQDYDLAQADQVGVVMSRTIANSVVMNKLPSSRPARLHNYDHDRYPKAPLITLTEDFLLINDKGRNQPKLNWKITRDELLIANNRFDQFLTRLDKTQRQRIRADIVDIDLFYLVMSIVKENNITIRHWHFDDTQQPNNTKPADNSRLEIVNSNKWQPKENKTNGLLLDLSNQSSAEDNQTLIPWQWDFSPIKDPFHPPRQQSTRSENTQNSYPSLGTDSADALFEAMKQALAEQRGIAQHVGALEFIDKLRFSFAGESDTHKLTPNKAPPQQHSKNNAPALFNQDSSKTIEQQLIDLLLSYLETVQNRYDAHHFVNLSLDDFAQNARQTNAAEYRQEIITINHNVNTLTNRQALLPTHYQHSDQTSVALMLNHNLDSITLNSQTQPDWLAPDNTLAFNLYAQPTIDKKTTLELNTSDIVLIPYAGAPPNEQKWLAAAVLNAQLDSIHFGFIYGKLNTNTLMLANSENDIIINDRHIIDHYQSNQHRHQLIEIILYILLAVSVLLWLIKRR